MLYSTKPTIINNYTLTVTTLAGLEAVLAKEVALLGGQNIELLKRAVRFEGDKKLMYRAVYELRTALRVFLPFHSFKTKHENHLYKKIREVDWTAQMQLEDTFMVTANTASKYLTHSKYVALKVKDAIVDQFRSHHNGQRPNIDRKTPTHQLNVHINKDNLCTLSWDISGAPLNQRGYRNATVEAPINEVLAAGIILSANWQRDSDFYDTMCGSGTFLIEAALYAHNIPPQIVRSHFAFMNTVDFDKLLWEKVKREAKSNMRPFKHQIIGYDKDLKAVKATRLNILAAELEQMIQVERKDFFKVAAPTTQGFLVINPPYDERLAIEDVRSFYKQIGDTLKNNFKNFDAWILSGNIRAMRQIGLKPSNKKILFNGPLECQLAGYEIY